MVPRAERVLRRTTLAAAALLLLAAAGPVPLLPPADHADWQAIGRLNVTGYRQTRMCTATLIAPDRVLTAAHCVLDEAGAPIAPDRFRFLAGYLQGSFAAQGAVAEVLPDPYFAGRTNPGRVPAGFDRALLILAAPLAGIAPLPVASPDPARPVRLLGYRRDRPHALSDTGACALAETSPDLRLTCPVTFGNSGGPVLQQDEAGRWQVVGVVSAMVEDGALAARLR